MANDPIEAAKDALCEAVNAYARELIAGRDPDREWGAIFVTVDALIAAVRAENEQIKTVIESLYGEEGLRRAWPEGVDNFDIQQGWDTALDRVEDALIPRQSS